ncbi:MAG: MBOAT family protein, partial [Lentisphaeria bacterium]|nr:MBOAT family protein [Lentisphaeria bacterium]
WFRDYVYIPLGGNRCARGGQMINLLVVWALTGLWHGSAWNFVLWGLYYAALLLGEKFLWGGKLEKLPRPVRHVYALVLIVIGWVLFRSTSLHQVLTMVTAMFGFAPGGGWSSEAYYYLYQFRWELLVAIPAALPVKIP